MKPCRNRRNASELRDSVSAAYEEFGRPSLVPRLTALAAKTVIFDVEPLIAYWDSGQEALDRGIAQVLRRTVAVPGLKVICFSTNSLRRPSLMPDTGTEVRVVYLAAAGKPLRTSLYRDFPKPGAVIGDQVATDGILARRLGYTFLECRPPEDLPAGFRRASRGAG